MEFRASGNTSITWGRFEGTSGRLSADLYIYIIDFLHHKFDSEGAGFLAKGSYSLSVTYWEKIAEEAGRESSSASSYVNETLQQLSESLRAGLTSGTSNQCGRDGYLLVSVRFTHEPNEIASSAPNTSDMLTSRDVSSTPGPMDIERERTKEEAQPPEPESKPANPLDRELKIDFDLRRRRTSNIAQADPSLLEPYQGQVIAWNPDGTKIIAHGDNYEALLKMLDQTGEPLSECLIQSLSEETML